MVISISTATQHYWNASRVITSPTATADVQTLPTQLSQWGHHLHHNHGLPPAVYQFTQGGAVVTTHSLQHHACLQQHTVLKAYITPLQHHACLQQHTVLTACTTPLQHHACPQQVLTSTFVHGHCNCAYTTYPYKQPDVPTTSTAVCYVQSPTTHLDSAISVASPLHSA